MIEERALCVLRAGLGPVRVLNSTPRPFYLRPRVDARPWRPADSVPALSAAPVPRRNLPYIKGVTPGL